MKHIVNKSYLVGLSLMSLFLMVGFVSVTRGQTIINTNPGLEDQHRGLLTGLFLGAGDKKYDTSWLKSNGGKNLDVLNGLIVGSGHGTSNGSLIVIGGGVGSIVTANNAGIGGGRENAVNGYNGAIGGGVNNNVSGENGVVAGGKKNNVGSGGVVVGGDGNNKGTSKGVVLGGYKNVAKGDNSLVLGNGSEGKEGSFAWNGVSNIENSARINASSGMLIGTYIPKEGVMLVVNGAIKLGTGDSNEKGEIVMDENGKGCIEAYDGSRKHILGKGSESKCSDVYSGCQFGNAILQDGETIFAYKVYYGVNESSSCSNSKVTIKCEKGSFVDLNGNFINYYPYCYDLWKK